MQAVSTIIYMYTFKFSWFCFTSHKHTDPCDVDGWKTEFPLSLPHIWLQNTPQSKMRRNQYYITINLQYRNCSCYSIVRQLLLYCSYFPVFTPHKPLLYLTVNPKQKFSPVPYYNTVLLTLIHLELYSAELSLTKDQEKWNLQIPAALLSRNIYMNKILWLNRFCCWSTASDTPTFYSINTFRVITSVGPIKIKQPFSMSETGLKSYEDTLQYNPPPPQKKVLAPQPWISSPFPIEKIQFKFRLLQCCKMNYLIHPDSSMSEAQSVSSLTSCSLDEGGLYVYNVLISVTWGSLGGDCNRNFWVVMLFSLVDIYQHIRGLHLQDQRVKMKAIHSSKISIISSRVCSISQKTMLHCSNQYL